MCANKMRASTWKKIQRLAYPFFIMIYIHVMVLYSAKFDKHMFDIIIYTLIFGAYGVLRIRKYIMKRKSKSKSKVCVNSINNIAN